MGLFLCQARVGAVALLEAWVGGALFGGTGRGEGGGVRAVRRRGAAVLAHKVRHCGAAAVARVFSAQEEATWRAWRGRPVAHASGAHNHLPGRTGLRGVLGWRRRRALRLGIGWKRGAGFQRVGGATSAKSRLGACCRTAVCGGWVWDSVWCGVGLD